MRACCIILIHSIFYLDEIKRIKERLFNLALHTEITADVIYTLIPLAANLTPTQLFAVSGLK
jgi:hypothetical protein